LEEKAGRTHESIGGQEVAILISVRYSVFSLNSLFFSPSHSALGTENRSLVGDADHYKRKNLRAEPARTHEESEK
jgi:hypothetical protein